MKIWIRAFVTIAYAALLCVSAAAQAYKVEKIAAPAPSELSAAVQGMLSGDAIRVNGGSGVFCELWLRKDVPVLSSPVKDLGITFGQIAEGTLVGAIRFPTQVEDFRKQSIPAGVYTLRYALIPVDGNHVGVSNQRDFLLISPAAADTDPGTLTRDQTLDLSRKASGSGHPSVWSLEPVSQSPPNFPAIVHQQEDEEYWALEFQLPAGGSIPMALVIVGHSPEV